MPVIEDITEEEEEVPKTETLKIDRQREPKMKINFQSMMRRKLNLILKIFSMQATLQQFNSGNSYR